jgi:hypothetical protein
MPYDLGATLTLNWQDNSDNEDGFEVERKEGNAAEYIRYGQVTADQTSFLDNAVIEGSTYCYRVAAFNAAGNSGYTAVECAYGLNVDLAGTGTGKVTGSGIDCGSDCTETYPADVLVTLTAVPNAGSLFAGWSGDSDCLDGVLGMGSAKNCTATFEIEPPPPPPPVTLLVSIIKVLTVHGSGDGSVSSSPDGIDCGASCSQSFASGTSVTLTADPDSTSIFTGWSGGGCSGSSTCTVTLAADTTVNANFEPEVFTLTVSVAGSGTVTGPGIDCGEDCSETYRTGELVTLTATSEGGGKLESWSDAGCASSSSCELTLTSDTALVATFGAEPVAPVPMLFGTVEADGQWRRVAFDEPFPDPVVIATGAGFNDPAPGIVRIQNVDDSGFDIRFQEWDYLDDDHPVESVGYIVVKRGEYELDDGTRLEANTVNTNEMRSYEAVVFNQSFELIPVVLTTVATVNESDALTTRIRNINTDGFELQLREQEANKKRHDTETVGYLAWEPSSGLLGGISFEVGNTQDVVTHNWYAIGFEASFADGPVFLAGMQTRDGGDTAAMRWQNKDEAGVDVKVEEEQSKNPEVNHTTEVVGYIVAE